MALSGWLQLLLFIGILAALTKPMGLYLEKVLDARGRTRLELPLGWLERFCYRLFAIDPLEEQGWKDYGVALLLFTVVTVLLSYGIMRLQGILPLNPQG